MRKSDTLLDGSLVSEYLSGDKKALAQLVKRWHKPFCNKAYWIVNDADLAKDIAQDCWSTIISRMNSLKDTNSFGSWALRIVYSKSLDELRKSTRKRKNQGEYAKDYEREIVADSEDDRSKLKIMLLKCINELSVHQQEVIKLFYVEEYSLKEISELLKISVGTAKSRLFHARENLKKSLKNKNHEKQHGRHRQIN